MSGAPQQQQQYGEHGNGGMRHPPENGSHFDPRRDGNGAMHMVSTFPAPAPAHAVHPCSVGQMCLELARTLKRWRGRRAEHRRRSLVLLRRSII
jgi:hypothetical protein